MQQLTNGQRLQQAYRQHIAPYSQFVQTAVTLTLKQSALIRVRRFTNYGDECYEFREYLDEDKLRSTIRYFTAQRCVLQVHMLGGCSVPLQVFEFVARLPPSAVATFVQHHFATTCVCEVFSDECYGNLYHFILIYLMTQ